ncbi:MAG: sterol-binding protein [Gammaproteobacteria bacterium (ex Lamellibrachia satsuma)]|nr:MAG: sterol-binding protein [Gammaproteobacteria bacterium (ex Lamellibrachia satsuma)]RRS33929.1 MAG: sterol-binding protein [Gammaproteobacteria bacterium (ex Lamellibrachia satsuma)]RRS37505.1 MAG: sterol-binding protein [Gammaproteobacteria bacterium (ex Lamellibrachia satsuma)]
MTQTIAKRPRLPRPLSLPLRLVPERAHSLVLGKMLNYLFATERAEGELDFLEDRTVRIQVTDARLSYALSLQDGLIAGVNGGEPANLTISGTVYDYMLLITGREDPDTLFFQRHLLMEGDTDLGVHLKNMLAAVDLDALPVPQAFRPMMDQCLSFYERLA